MAPWGRRNSPVPRRTRQNRPEIKRPTECNPTTGEEKKVRGDLCIYRCVPPTHEYGTRPFLRWARSQGRSPHTSGKAKNTFGPVGIPLFGAPQAPGNKPPRRGYKPGGTVPWGRRNSPVPRRTRQNRPEIKRPTECNPTTGEEKKSAGTSVFIVASHQRTNMAQGRF